MRWDGMLWFCWICCWFSVVFGGLGIVRCSLLGY